MSRASLPRVEQFFAGNNEILIAGPEVVEYPWTWHEERKKNISSGFRLLGVMSGGVDFDLKVPRESRVHG